MSLKQAVLKYWLAGLIFAVSGLHAQAPDARPVFDEFEVATVKRAPADWPSAGRSMSMETTHQFAVKNYPLRMMLAAAYNLPPKAVSGGPSWLDSDGYDVLGETPGSVRPTFEEQMTMLRKVLSERFNLTLHREEKEFSIYALTVAKGGPKLMEAAPTPEGVPLPYFLLSPQGAKLTARSATMFEVAWAMQRTAVDRPVVDKTGLSGRYDIDLEWTPDETQFPANRQIFVEEAEHPHPDLFAAMQEQLGLRLEATKGPIATLVIDRVTRPTEN
jgi:uncharacterized protein (TIGR03435 family)